LLGPSPPLSEAHPDQVCPWIEKTGDTIKQRNDRDPIFVLFM
jgi:hypothetical protein